MSTPPLSKGRESQRGSATIPTQFESRAEQLAHPDTVVDDSSTTTPAAQHSLPGVDPAQFDGGPLTPPVAVGSRHRDA